MVALVIGAQDSNPPGTAGPAGIRHSLGNPIISNLAVAPVLVKSEGAGDAARQPFLARSWGRPGRQQTPIRACLMGDSRLWQ